MIPSKKFLSTGFILVSCSLLAQNVVPTKSEQRIKGEKAIGYSTPIQGTKAEVNASLLKYMRSFGKPKQQEEILVVLETTLNGQAYTKPLYAQTKTDGEFTTAWIGVNLKEWGADSAAVTTQLESLVKRFGVSFYHEKIQVQIDEAQQAVEAVEKQEQRTQTENRNIQQRIENNKKEHAQLKRMIQNNRTDSVNLFLRLEQNKRSTDSLRIVSDKVKRALSFQKERQQKVN